MLKLIICGINGSLGSSIYSHALNNGHLVSCGIDKITVDTKDCPVYSSFDQIRHLADVIVDFSHPSILDDLLNFAIENSMPLVIGTTGHTSKQQSQIVEASKKIPIFKSSNFSLGIQLLIKLCQMAISNFNDCEVEIIEKHHSNKIDAPSGTAIEIANSLKSVSGNQKILSYGRKGKRKRLKNEISIHSIRGGSTIGEHSVLFFGKNESITITHTANSKSLFAQGTIKACEFITTKKFGLYGIDSLYN